MNFQELSDSSFDQALAQSTRPALVYFWVPWSKPCESFTDTLEDLQTNYDQPGPDCASDARRTKAEETMRSLGQDEGSTQLGVFAAVSTPPVLNDGTAYTAVMRAATGELHAFVRDSTAPP